MEFPQYCISGENTGEMAPELAWLGLEGAANCPMLAWGCSACPEAARVALAPELSQANASASPTQITIRGGIKNPDKQPPCDEKAVVWLEGREACLEEGMAPKIC